MRDALAGSDLGTRLGNRARLGLLVDLTE